MIMREVGMPYPRPRAALWLLLTHTHALVFFFFLAGSWNSIQKWTFQRQNSTEPSPSPPLFQSAGRMGQDTYCQTCRDPLPWAGEHSQHPRPSLLWRQLREVVLTCPVLSRTQGHRVVLQQLQPEPSATLPRRQLGEEGLEQKGC